MTASDHEAVRRIMLAASSDRVISDLSPLDAEAFVRALVQGVDAADPLVREVAHDAPPPSHGFRFRGIVFRKTLDLSEMSSDSSLFFDHCRLEGGLTVKDSRLRTLSLTGCRLGSPEHDLPALDARGCRVSHNVLCVDSRCDSRGHAVRLDGAVIEGDLDLSGTGIWAGDGSALCVAGAKLSKQFSLRGSRINSRSRSSAIDASGLRVGGQWDMELAKVRNVSGPSVRAGGAKVDGNVNFSRGYYSSASGQAAIDLQFIETRAFLSAAGTIVVSHSGPAIEISGGRVGQQASFNGLRVLCASVSAAVDLSALHCAGDMVMEELDVVNKLGPALNLGRADVEGGLSLSRSGLKSAGTKPVLNLRGASVGRQFSFGGLTSERPPGVKLLELDGFVYPSVPDGIDTMRWLELLTENSEFSARAFNVLASAAIEAGDSRLLKRTLIARRRAQLALPSVTWAQRLWGTITWYTLGHGYQPWRALVWLLGLVAAAVAVNTTFHALLRAPVGGRCTIQDGAATGLSVGFPLIRISGIPTCFTRSTVDSAWLLYVNLTILCLSWAFATLFIAGFTRAVRET